MTSARRILAGSIVLACITAQAEPPNPKVVERYKQMLAAKPEEGTALERLWKIYLEQNQTNALIAEYQAIGTFASEMVLGHLLRRAGSAEEALAAFARAAAMEPRSAQPWLGAAVLQLERGRKWEAAESYEKAAAALPEKDPQLADVLLQAGAAWLAAGDLAKATTAWEHTVALDPRNLDLRRRLAEACLSHGQPARALVHLQYLETHAPPQERAQALQQLARLHQADGEQDAAIAALERALAGTAPGNWLRGDLQSQMIRLHQRYHRVPELEERWQKNVRENPRDLAAYLQLIDLYERTGELEQEREWLEKLTALAPKLTEHRLKLARLLVQLDQPDEAAARFDQLLKEQPANADLVFERARLDVQREAMDAARTRIGALLEAAKNDDAIRARALEFYRAHRLHELVEAHLRADAARGGDEAVMALANFFFDQQRPAEARVTLDRLVPANGTPPQRMAALSRQAQILKERHELAPAAEALRKALAIDAKARETWTFLGEIESALGRPAEARLAHEQALALSRTPQERIEADQKIFESFRSEPAGKAAGPGGGELSSYLLNITRSAVAQPSVEAWLRVARWNLWSRNPRPAIEYAQKALALDPASLDAHEMMVKLASSEPRTGVARTHLDALASLHPAGKADYQRRAGQLELQAGNVAEALRLFTELAESHPGGAEALTDLALAQQRAEAWSGALATWQKVAALTPASRRKDVIGPLMRAYERLSRPKEGAQLLLEQIDAAPDKKEQLATLQELLSLCEKHDLLSWLREEFERRRKVRVDDYFTEMAYGRILKLTGKQAAAFEILADASFAAPNQAEALPELVREAEELRKLDVAVRLQTQLVRIVPQTGPEGWMKLARLEEKRFDFESATQAWEKVVARHPRETGALEEAVAFHLRWGDPARAAALLRKLRALDPANLRALAQLAQLDLEAGELAEAQDCLEQILARSTPVPADEPVRIPGVKSGDRSRVQQHYMATVRSRGGDAKNEVIRALRKFWAETEPSARSDRERRLEAIRDLGQLLQIEGDATVLEAWTERWRAPDVAPTEALWAWYYAGASGPLLDRLDAMMATAPSDAQITQGFIWLALQTAEFARLGAWLHDARRTSVERDYFFIALGQYLQARPASLDPDFIEQLFPPHYHQRLWQAAAILANRGYLREAEELGTRVFQKLSTQRAGYGVELAHWQIQRGEIEAARRTLRESLGTPGESYEAPVFAAMRELYLLLPEAERSGFAESVSREVATPLHAALTRLLLAGLSGREDKARTQMQRLLELRALAPQGVDETGNSATRVWDFILNTGVQLQAWKLDRLAVEWWEMALADEALIQLEMQTQGEAVLAKTREVRARLAALQLLRARPVEADAIFSKHERLARGEGLPAIAEALEGMGAFAPAILVYREAWEREPASVHALRNVLAACRAGGDFDTLEQVLGRCVREKFFGNNEAVHRDLALQFADLLERRGATAEAQTVLGEAFDGAPADARSLERLAQFHERARRLPEAEAAFRRMLLIEPANTAVRVALASTLQAQDRVDEGLDVLVKSSGVEADTRLVQLYAAAERFDDAMAVLERLSPPHHISAALLLADRLLARGERDLAANALRIAIARSPDARAAFPLQSKLIELLDSDGDRALVLRNVRRLRRAAGDEPELLTGYFELMLREAPRLQCEAEFVRELSEEWEDGGGRVPAGVSLLAWHLQKKETAMAETVWTQLIAREDLDEAAWLRIIAALEAATRPDLAVEARARLARQTPANATRLLEWARALQALQRTSEARQALEEVTARGILNDELAGDAARLFGELRESARARALFARVIAGDPAARNFRAYLDYARLLLAEGEPVAARQHFLAAFRNPANGEFGELIRYLEATKRLAHFDDEIAAFELGPQRMAAARRALSAHRATARGGK